LGSPTTAIFLALGKVLDIDAPRDDGVSRLGEERGDIWQVAAPTVSGAVAVAAGAAVTACWNEEKIRVRCNGPACQCQFSTCERQWTNLSVWETDDCGLLDLHPTVDRLVTN
jgi:hypothetical protein